jgi:GTPase
MNDNKLPVVVIIGRPNVGKSTLFNRLLGKQAAVTHESSGVTRDRQYHPLEWNGKEFLLVDTGGLTNIASHERLGGFIRKQVDAAVHEADLLLFLVDAQVSLADEDLAIAKDIKKLQKNILLVANKVDNSANEAALYEFLALGLGDAMPVSAVHGRNAGDLLDSITEKLVLRVSPESGERDLKLAIVGRPNVGKSTLVNRLLGFDRMITDDRPGTTRDSVDASLNWEGRRYCLIDTAGLRKRSHVHEPVEERSALHTQLSIERCDVALVLAEAGPEIEEQDVKIIQAVIDKGKGVLVGLNKWDLKEKETKTFDGIVKQLKARYPFMSHLPVLAMSAKTGQRVNKVLEIARRIDERFEQPYAPQDFRDFLRSTTEKHNHPNVAGKKVAFHSLILKSRRPLVFEIKTNHPREIRESYVRYLENRFYERFDAEGIPIKIKFSKKGR